MTSKPLRRLDARMPSWTDQTIVERAPARPDRGSDRVHSGLLDRPHAAGRPFPRLQVDRQHLRGADPARRDPGDPSVYFAPAVADRRSTCRRPATRRFVVGILLAFLPAAVIGALAHDFIKTVLFETPMLICIVLIVGGVVLLAVDRMPLKPRYTDVMDYPLSLCLQDRPVPVPGDDPGHLALGRDHRRRAADGHRQALGGGILVLPRHADHGRRLRLRPLQEPRRAVDGRPADRSPSASSWPSSPRCSWCATCSTTSRATASRCSPGGASSSAAWARGAAHLGLAAGSGSSPHGGGERNPHPCSAAPLCGTSHKSCGFQNSPPRCPPLSSLFGQWRLGRSFPLPAQQIGRGRPRRRERR